MPFLEPAPCCNAFPAGASHRFDRATNLNKRAPALPQGLVDTAVKTAETGYMSRRLMKALEDLYVG